MTNTNTNTNANPLIRSTKIVATIGPSTNTLEILQDILAAGVDMVRLNFSHGVPEDHIQRANMVRQAALNLGREVAIMGDLQGPKIRVGKFEHGQIDLQVGQVFTLDANCSLGNQHKVGLDYKELPQDVHIGDILLLNDGLIVLKVDAVKGSEIITHVEVGGILSNNKGINRQGGGLTAPALTQKDKQDILTAAKIGVDYIAVSFPKNPQDMEEARKLMHAACEEIQNKDNKNQHKVKLIAKIERIEAIELNNLQAIIYASDGVMVARGDLAVEVGNAAVPALQKTIIKMARESNKLVITATQMMESMIQNPVPTRAEVSDVANAVLDGTDAVMLSAETASGKYPLQTIQQVANICIEAEKFEVIHLDTDFLDRTFSRIDQSIANGALFTAFHLGAKAIIALTESGATALWMSRKKIKIPIIALTPNIASQRKMALYRNVTAVHMDTQHDRDAAIQQAQTILKDKGLVQSGDFIVITMGSPMGQAGGTNGLTILKI
jgi:pyruvate kinase